MSNLNGLRSQVVPVWQNRVRMRVLSKGSGPNLVFFHGPWGLHWNPFLDALAQHFTVHAPEHPGTSPGTPEDIYHLDGLWDLILCYEELLEQLGLDGAALGGHPLGPPAPTRPPARHRSDRPLARRRPRPYLDDAQPAGAVRPHLPRSRERR